MNYEGQRRRSEPPEREMRKRRTHTLAVECARSRERMCIKQYAVCGVQHTRQNVCVNVYEKMRVRANDGRYRKKNEITRGTRPVGPTGGYPV